MTPLDLAAIEARCEKFHRNTGACSRCPLIASYGTDVPALCAEVRRLMADNERMRRGLLAIRDGAMSFASERAVNLLAGREWSESGVE